MEMPQAPEAGAKRAAGDALAGAEATRGLGSARTRWVLVVTRFSLGEGEDETVPAVGECRTQGSHKNAVEAVA